MTTPKPMSEERLAEIEDKWGGAVRDDLRELVAEVRRLRASEAEWQEMHQQQVDVTVARIRERDDARACQAISDSAYHTQVQSLRSQLALAKGALIALGKADVWASIAGYYGPKLEAPADGK